MNENRHNKIAVVVVTYNNIGMLEDLLRSFYDQTKQPDEIIVVGNASFDDTENILKEQFPKIKYLRLNENMGSAGGYYEGIKIAVERSDFIYTLDDDVELRDDAIDEIVKGFNGLDDRNVTDVAAVRSVWKGCQLKIPEEFAVFSWRGTLIKSTVVRELGLPVKEFFLYGDDLEYSLRFAKKGYRFFWIPTSVCTERRASGKTFIKVFKREIRLYNTPFRLYYAFRNEVYIYISYRYIVRLLKTIMYGVKVIIYFMIFDGSCDKSKIWAIMEGVTDGVKGRLGKNAKYSKDQ